MQITVIGCGKVGKALIAQLSSEGHNITAVDINAELVREVAIAYDIIGVVGNGASYTVLQDADLEHTDVLIAVTESDEVNLLCCVIAKKKATARQSRGCGIRFIRPSGISSERVSNSR